MPRRALPYFTRVVYVLEAANGLLKFGCTKDLRSRIGSLQTLAPDRLRCVAWAKGSPIEEAALHIRLLESVHHGEWFNPTPEVLAVVGSFKRVVGQLRRKLASSEARIAVLGRQKEIRRDARRILKGGGR